jgi:hypothetical protein
VIKEGRFTGLGQISYFHANGFTYVSFNTNGDGTAEMGIALKNEIDLGRQDFHL